MGAAAVPVLIALTAGSTGAQIQQSRQQAKEERKFRKRTAARQQALEAEATQQQEQERASAQLDRRRDIQRRRVRADQSRLRGGTIRTTPLGVGDAERSAVLGG